MLELTINGKTVSLEHSLTIAAFLSKRGIAEKMVVVEHNGVIIPRNEYGMVFLKAGDAVEIVQMMAGG